LDASSWSDYRETVWDIAAEFRARGNRIAMLSNGVAEIICRVRTERHLEALFDVVIVSCEVGQCKPEPDIYRMCLDQLAVPAALTLFVDDRLENVAAAENAGLRTFHFSGDQSVAALRNALDL
jgi:putative hydrolase of the HAD superfamily